MADGRRFAYNWALERATAGAAVVSAWGLMHELASVKESPNGTWLRSIDSQLLQQAVRDAVRSSREWKAGRAGRPRFRSRKRDRARFRIPQRVAFDDWRVRCPKIGWIRCRGGRAPVGPIKTATFSRDFAGRWFVSLVVEVERVAPPAELETTVGIDMGLIDLIVRSDGLRTTAPRFLDRGAHQLQRSHRSLHRKAPGSANRRNASRRLAQEYRQVSDRRNDFLHKASLDLLAKFDLVCVEGLNARGLARTKLARSAQDAAFGELRRQLVYKAETTGTKVVVADRFFPSSKRCSGCGTVNKGLHRRTRVWTCSCGETHDRDVNAALNLQDEGIRIALAGGYADKRNARGVGISLSSAEQPTLKRELGANRDATSEVLCASSSDG